MSVVSVSERRDLRRPGERLPVPMRRRLARRHLPSRYLTTISSLIFFLYTCWLCITFVNPITTRFRLVIYFYLHLFLSFLSRMFWLLNGNFEVAVDSLNLISPILVSISSRMKRNFVTQTNKKDFILNFHRFLDVDECSVPELCRNSLSCENTPGNYTCTCVKGFHGRQCQYNVNDCHGHQCLNGATCIDLIDEYHCACRPGFNGNSIPKYIFFWF